MNKIYLDFSLYKQSVFSSSWRVFSSIPCVIAHVSLSLGSHHSTWRVFSSIPCVLAHVSLSRGSHHSTWCAFSSIPCVLAHVSLSLVSHHSTWRVVLLYRRCLSLCSLSRGSNHFYMNKRKCFTVFLWYANVFRINTVEVGDYGASSILYPGV